MPIWRLNGSRVLDLSRPRVIAILNVTPDSFADGGQLSTPQRAADAARRAVDEGADALDVGPASTRPGADPVDADEQIRRAAPAIKAIRDAGVEQPITIDTTLAPVARAALDAGADAINDVSAGQEDPDLLPLAVERGVGLILMHRRVPPAHDQYADRYERTPDYGAHGVVHAVRASLAEQLDAAHRAGVPRERVVLDPGLGFGKSVEQNLELLRGTPELLGLGCPVLSALSLKNFVGRVGLGRDSAPAERLPATLALSVAHLRLGVRLFRVHNVPEHRQALDAAWAARSDDERVEQADGVRGFPS